MAGNGAQGEGCLARSRGGLFIALELGHFTVVKGNKFASLAPRVKVKATDTYLTKVTYHCGGCRGGFGSCAWDRKITLHANISMQGYYLKQRHNDRLRLFTRSHDYKARIH